MMIPKGKLLIIGGKEDRFGTDVKMEDDSKAFSPEEILKLLVKSTDDRVEVITTATSEPESTKETYQKTFTQIGYTNFDFLHICKDWHSEKYEKRIADAKTVFFTGGDQEVICNELKDSPITAQLRNKYLNEEDFIIAGTSAGAMCMSEIFIAEAKNGEAMVDQDIKLAAGLGFINTCIIDTHFVNRGRFGRLAHASILHQDLFGVGLGEDTALVIENGVNAICKGSGMVIIISAKEVKQTNTDFVKKGCPVYAENLKVHLLTDSCTINLQSGEMKGYEEKNEQLAR